jgi:hypothetical protein
VLRMAQWLSRDGARAEPLEATTREIREDSSVVRPDSQPPPEPLLVRI